MLIGICGKSGSGKSTLANKIVEKYASKVIHCDIDKIGHKALQDDLIKKELIKQFGYGIVSNNSIDRKELSKIVFNSTKQMEKLTNITWKYMEKEIDKIIDNNPEKTIILDWLLLPKSKHFKNCSMRILLSVPYETRMKRALLRDNITEEAFALREKASYQYNESSFDYVIRDNKNEIERLVHLI